MNAADQTSSLEGSRRFLEFNKHLLVGEVGALIGTPLVPWIAARFTTDASVISFTAVLGGLFTSSLFWLLVKWRDRQRRGGGDLRALAGEVAYYTPAAIIAGLVAYQPTLYFVTRHLIVAGHAESAAALVGQLAAFAGFVVVINLYRVGLRRYAGKIL